MLESEIQTRILLAYGNLLWLRISRMNTGKALIKGRWVAFGLPGLPDIVGIMLPNGRAVGIEVKTATGRQRDTQVSFQKVFERFGGLYILARSTDDVKAGFIAAGVSPALLP